MHHVFLCISTVGKYRDHLDVFRKVRDSRVQRIAVETNRLLVRLEKVSMP